MKYSRPGPTQAELTKTRDRLNKGRAAANQPLPGSAPSQALVNTGALTAEQEALAAANRKVRNQQQAAQIRKVASALAGAKVANSLAAAKNIAFQLGTNQAPDAPSIPPAAAGTDSLLD